MALRIEVRAGPLRWSRPLRLPRAQRNALNLIGSMLYVALLVGLWFGYALALLYQWRFAIVVFLAIGVVLIAGLWWLGRRVFENPVR
jgi:predicted MFS family arabinose efflux permease